MQVNAALRSNSTKVIDCIAWLLGQIKPANSGNGRAYTTDGIVVERTRDPRKLNQNLATDFRNLGTIVKIREVSGKVQLGTQGVKVGPMGNVKRTLAGVDLICCSTLSDAQDRAKITCDQIQSWLRDDIDQALSNDDTGVDCITRASNALATLAGPWGGPGLWGSRPSCINLEIIGWANLPNYVEFPNFAQVIRLSYLFDKTGPGRRPGVL